LRFEIADVRISKISNLKSQISNALKIIFNDIFDAAADFAAIIGP
jgi:hypothetical protein